MRFERAQRLPFRFFLLMKPGGLWQAYPAEEGKRIVRSVQKFCGVGAAKRRCRKMKSSHKYVFYFYPTWRKNERGEIEEIKGSFRFFERVKDGKAAAARMGRKYDHQKIFWVRRPSKMRRWCRKKSKAQTRWRGGYQKIESSSTQKK